MPTLSEQYPGKALITGASSGIGAEYARQLAAEGFDLVIVARRQGRLDSLKSELEGRYGTACEYIAADLATPKGLNTARERLAQDDISLFVNNAGFGQKGFFPDTDLEQAVKMVRLNCEATLVLVHAAASSMQGRGPCGIIILSSIAAFQGTPFTSAYAATKGFDLLLGEGLYQEMRSTPIDILTVCPGPTDTEGPRNTGIDPAAVSTMMSAAAVVKASLKALGKRPLVVPGFFNRVGALLVKIMPRSIAAWISGKMIQRVIQKSQRSLAEN